MLEFLIRYKRRKQHKEFVKLVNKNFQEARNFIEERWLKLNNIELGELRKLVEYTTDIDIKDYKKFVKPKKWDDYQIHPDYEAALIFMNKNYGLQIYCSEDKSNFNIQRMYDEELLGHDYYPEIFKNMQDEMHTRIGY